jgi:SAM-dependent methyltransferase
MRMRRSWMFDCTTDKYEQLYARWLEKPGVLLTLAEWKPGQVLLDLCGGTGAVSREALQRGAKSSEVVLLDLNPRAADLPDIVQVPAIAEAVGTTLFKGQFDLVVCRQAIAYLDLEEVAAGVAKVLKTTGKFVFNTFVRPRWSLKSYRYAGRRFFEASGYVGSTVFHLQAGWGVGWDLTKFRWYREEELGAILAQRFDFEVRRVNASSLHWICQKKAP